MSITVFSANDLEASPDGSVQKVRDTSIDFSRGVLIVLMVLYHFRAAGWFANEQTAVIASMHIFRMPVFLILSGFLFRPVLTKAKAIRNIRVLAIPYVLFISAYLLSLIAVDYLGIPINNPPPETVGSFLWAIFCKPYGPYWFIHNIIVMQVLCSISFALSRRVSEGVTTSAIIVVCLYCLVEVISPVVVKQQALVFFTMGWILYQLSEKLPQNCAISVALILAGIVTVFAEFDETLSQLLITYGALGIFLFFGRLASGKSFGAFFSWLGQNTLIIVLTHPAFLMATKFLAPLTTRIDPTGILHSFVGLSLGLAGPLALGALVDVLRLSPIIFGKEQITTPWPHSARQPGGRLQTKC